MNGHEKGDTKIAKRRHDNLKKPCFQGVWRSENTVQVLFPAPSALTIGAASELIRNDGFAFLYAKTRPFAALIPHIPQEYTVGPASWAGVVCKSFGSATSGFQFPWIFPDLPCTACTACIRRFYILTLFKESNVCYNI